MDSSASERVVMRNVAKRFGQFVAIHEASMSIRAGEIHALVGENGAGKSTLMNILYGLLPRSGGEVLLRGEPVDFAGPAEAIGKGIGMVHQHFKLAPSFTVAENIVLGSEPAAFGRLDRAEVVRRSRALSEKFGFDLDPRAVVGTLPVGLQQRVEILKALYRDAEILILDEPTSVLTPQETRSLFETLRALAANGRSIIFITHKLREVLAVSDRISVMRQGRIIATKENQGVTAEELARLMVGRPVLLRVAKTAARPEGRPSLEVRDLVVGGDRGEVAVEHLSLTVRPGEIVGLAGVQGNGQDELVQCIAGLRRPLSGTIEICGKSIAGSEPRTCRAAGLAYVPADRGRVGLSMASRIWENMTLGHQNEFARGPFFATRSARRRTSELIRQFDVRGARPETLARSLSGGNQQKVQLARELTRNVQVILAEQPSQGVDIGAIESIHRTLVAMRDAGRAVFVISADLDEVFGLADRILVIYRGRIVADLPTNGTDFEEVGRYMGGLHDPDEPAPPIDGSGPKVSSHVH
jgi:simple sugar transport system ATP-binding protein